MEPECIAECRPLSVALILSWARAVKPPFPRQSGSSGSHKRASEGSAADRRAGGLISGSWRRKRSLRSSGKKTGAQRNSSSCLKPSPQRCTRRPFASPSVCTTCLGWGGAKGARQNYGLTPSSAPPQVTIPVISALYFTQGEAVLGTISCSLSRRDLLTLLVGVWFMHQLPHHTPWHRCSRCLV